MGTSTAGARKCRAGPTAIPGDAGRPDSLLYPGEEKVHPDQDRGLAGPVASVQLANLRRGLQDHQYLTLARKMGLAAFVADAKKANVTIKG